MEETLHWWSLRGKVWQRNGGRYYVDSLFEDPSQVLSHPSYHNVRVNTSSPGLSVTVLDILYLFDRKVNTWLVQFITILDKRTYSFSQQVICSFLFVLYDFKLATIVWNYLAIAKEVTHPRLFFFSPSVPFQPF